MKHARRGKLARCVRATSPRLRTRQGPDASEWFPEVGQALERYGRARALRKCWYPDCDPVIFCIFDLLVVQGIPEQGIALFAHAVVLELEGIVGKRKDSVHVAGERTDAWRKVRRPGAVPPERFRFDR